VATVLANNEFYFQTIVMIRRKDKHWSMIMTRNLMLNPFMRGLFTAYTERMAQSFLLWCCIWNI